MLSTLKPLMGAAGAGFAVAAIQMAMVVLAARTLDIALYGVFALALGLANLLAEIGTAGLPVLANRILARYGARGHGARIAQFIAHGDGVVIRVTAIGLVLLGAGALLLAPDAPVAAPNQAKCSSRPGTRKRLSSLHSPRATAKPFTKPKGTPNSDQETTASRRARRLPSSP